jgi:hypothetical protein
LKKLLFSLLVILIMTIGCSATATAPALTPTGDAGTETAKTQVAVATDSEPVSEAAPEALPDAVSEHTVVLHSIAEEDGNLRPTDGHPDLVVGDDVHDKARQAFLSFDISGIPRYSVVTSASLQVDGTKLGEPFTDLGELGIYNDQYGVLGSEDFTVNPTEPVMKAFSFYCPPSGSPFSSAKLITEVQKRVNAGDSRFQVRLQFEKQTNLDSEWDVWQLTNPELVITYKD